MSISIAFIHGIVSSSSYFQGVSSLHAIPQSHLATWSGWSWWRYCHEHQACASFSCLLLFSSSPSAFSGHWLRTLRSDAEFDTLNSGWWGDLQLLTVVLKILWGFLWLFLIFYVACCYKGCFRNTAASWLSAIHDYILLHSSSNGLVVSLRHTP